MKNNSVIIVAVALLAAVGLVWTMSSSHDKGASPFSASAKPGEAIAKDSGSPVVANVDAYEYLDLVPVGHAAPNFVAKTAEGKPIQLKDFKGKKNVVMIFYQGSFCSVCAAQLSNVQKHITDYQKQDAEVLAISSDKPANAMKSVGENGLSFPVIPDSDLKIIKAYGTANIGKHLDGHNIAWPVVYVVDKQGMVRVAYADAHGNRLHSSDILPYLSKITGKPAPKLTYEQ